MSADAPMNGLFVMTDQHQAMGTGYENHAQALTPNMDRLAWDGARFRHGCRTAAIGKRHLPAQPRQGADESNTIRDCSPCGR